MPLPTIHLIAAQKIAHAADYSLSSRYLLGSIAPDAIHMRPKCTREWKDRTHLRIPKWADAWANSIDLLENSAGNSFLVGCALHNMLDKLWVEGPWRAFRAALPADMVEREWKQIYYQDMNIVDRWFSRQPEGRQLWNAVMHAPVTEYLDMVSASEVSLWRRECFDKFSAERPFMQAQLITVEVTQTFIEEAAEELGGILKQISASKNAEDEHR